MVEELNSKLKENDCKSLVALEEKVKVSEVKLREVEEESRAKEADMHKVYDLVNRLLDNCKIQISITWAVVNSSCMIN